MEFWSSLISNITFPRFLISTPHFEFVPILFNLLLCLIFDASYHKTIFLYLCLSFPFYHINHFDFIKFPPQSRSRRVDWILGDLSRWASQQTPFAGLWSIERRWAGIYEEGTVREPNVDERGTQGGKLQAGIGYWQILSVAPARPCNLWSRHRPNGKQRRNVRGCCARARGTGQENEDSNSNSLLPSVKYNSRAHSRLDNPRSLCMKTYYGAGSSGRTRSHCPAFPPAALLFSVEHDKSNYTFKLRYTILSSSFSFSSLLTDLSAPSYRVSVRVASFRSHPPSFTLYFCLVYSGP